MKRKYTFMEMVDLSYSDHYRDHIRWVCWAHMYDVKKHAEDLDQMVKDLVLFDDYLNKYALSLAV